MDEEPERRTDSDESGPSATEGGAQAGMVLSQQTRATFSGPVPPPAILKGYEEFGSGSGSTHLGSSGATNRPPDPTGEDCCRIWRSSFVGRSVVRAVCFDDCDCWGLYPRRSGPRFGRCNHSDGRCSCSGRRFCLWNQPAATRTARKSLTSPAAKRPGRVAQTVALSGEPILACGPIPDRMGYVGRLDSPRKEGARAA